MSDLYSIDLKSISLAAYEQELEQTELLPSRKILQEELASRFDCLQKQGLCSLNDLVIALKTPEKTKALAHKTGIPEEYLIILKREISSFQPKPVDLADFPGISSEVIQILIQLGIKNTQQLFERIKTPGERLALSQATGISSEIILELTKLTDVSRIRWVGANFARLLVDSEWDTVQKVVHADYSTVHSTLIKINEEKQYFKGKFGLNDMKLCVLAAKKVPDAILY